MEKYNSQENNFKHLKVGIVPITTCLDTAGNGNIPELTGEVEQVDLYSNPEEARKDGFVKEGERSYVFSPIDNLSKFSVKFLNCTGIVAVGNDLETHQNISFMTHQNPGYFFYDEKEKFIEEFKQMLSKMKMRCEQGTVDIVIFGGQFMKFKEFADDHEAQKHMKGEYINSIKLVNDLIEREFGFSPTVVGGPKFDGGQDFVVFDNENRRLYLTRATKGLPFTGSFEAKDIDSKTGSWKAGEVSIKEYLRRANL
jgi:hypothetical protein